MLDEKKGDTEARGAALVAIEGLFKVETVGGAKENPELDADELNPLKPENFGAACLGSQVGRSEFGV